MSVRREGREAAVQFLYSLDRNRAPDGSDFALFWSIHQAGPAVRAFAEELVRGLLPQLPGIDAATWRAPWTSISSTTGWPASTLPSTSERRVP